LLDEELDRIESQYRDLNKDSETLSNEIKVFKLDCDDLYLKK